MLNLDLGDYVTGSVLTNAPSSCSECKQHDTHILIINGRVSDFKSKWPPKPKCWIRGWIYCKWFWGVASARHVSGLTVNNAPFTFDAPFDPSVVRWEFMMMGPGEE